MLELNLNSIYVESIWDIISVHTFDIFEWLQASEPELHKWICDLLAMFMMQNLRIDV